MSRDYAKAKNSRGRRNPPPKKRGTLFIILVILGGIFYYAFSRGILVFHPEAEHQVGEGIRPAHRNTAQHTPAKPKFEFYTALSKESVPVSDEEEHASADATTARVEPEEKTAVTEEMPGKAPTGVPAIPTLPGREAPAGTPAPNTSPPAKTAVPTASKKTLPPVVQAKPVVSSTRYILQVASLQRASDADRLKAQLVLQGYDVSVQPFQHSGTTWLRVKVGPYHSLAEAQRARQSLRQQHHYNSILIRIN